MLKYYNLGAFLHITLLKYSSSARVNGKVLVGSDNHMHNIVLSQGWNMGEFIVRVWGETARFL